MKVIKLIQTCSACPSQWEGNLNHGRMFYCRYRHGILTISISTIKTNNVDKLFDNEKELYNEKLGNDFDGLLSTEKLLEIMKTIGFTFSKNTNYDL